MTTFSKLEPHFGPDRDQLCTVRYFVVNSSQNDTKSFKLLTSNVVSGTRSYFSTCRKTTKRPKPTFLIRVDLVITALRIHLKFWDSILVTSLPPKLCCTKKKGSERGPFNFIFYGVRP